MSYAKNGAALIDGNIVPPTEVILLRTLVILKSATVPEIALEVKERYSDSALYSFLKRLVKRGLVTNKKLPIPPAQTRGRSSYRIFWSPTRAAIEFFKDELENKK
ncbi:MAG: hypothetical protein HYV45_01790 [Candidatus Moranbacteria bacterium]|nr:hypothetical protein [Candidatus Moranbacteria bacterium]